ncbi:MAG: thiamine-phosphate kinase [Flavobacteriales bacterium]|nr:thiamine-phosphate kinase [Flavobacteriales bacterium]MDW8433019.1 thiamine-phosphate kinase [Flavobacteriales bacterium]
MSSETLKELGEFGFIQKIRHAAPPLLEDVLVGIGDDAAALKNTGLVTVVTTDMLVEGVHFDIRYAPLQMVGYKLVSVNVSDCCAMNAQPAHFLVSLAASSKYELPALNALYEGIYKACARYKIDVIGGDTNTAVSGLTLSGTCIGYASAGKIVTRGGAQVHDLLCVTGNLGGAYAGLTLLEREKRIFLENSNIQPDLSRYPYIVERQLKPEARVDIVAFFEKARIQPTAMLDISDGLANEVLHLCKSSRKGCVIFENRLPLHEETAAFLEEVRIAPLIAQLNGGEDYELLFSVPPQDYDKIKDDPRITVIGYITEEGAGCKLHLKSGEEIDLEMKGYNAFSENFMPII